MHDNVLAAQDGQVLAAQNSRTMALAAQTDALAARLEPSVVTPVMREFELNVA